MTIENVIAMAERQTTSWVGAAESGDCLNQVRENLP